MDKQEALERYKKVIDTDIIKYYEDADKYQWYNLDDPDLHPIRTLIVTGKQIGRASCRERV